MRQDENLNKLVVTIGTVFLTWALLIFTTACGENKGNNAAPAPVPPPCSTPNCYTYPNGTGIVNNYVGFNSQNYYPNTSYWGYTNYNTSSTLTVGIGLEKVLEEAMGACNRNTYSGGLSACNSWTSGYHKITIEAAGSTARQIRFNIYSYPKVDPYVNYQYSLPSLDQFLLGMFGFGNFGNNTSGFYNPMILNFELTPQGNGFEARGYGPPITSPYYGLPPIPGKLFQLQTTGKLEDGSMNYTLFYNGQQAASGTLVRCQTQGCAY